MTSAQPTRSGYKFSNWNDKYDGTGTTYLAGGTYKISGSTTLYAQYTYIPVTSITLNKSETTILKGTTETLTANIEPDNATNKEVEWSSSNETVATVDNGVVKALSEGTTTIKATSKYDNRIVGSCTVTVRTPTTEEIIDLYGEETQTKSEYGKNNAGYAASVTVTLDLGEGTWGIRAPTSGVGVSRSCNFGQMDQWYIITIPAGSTRRLTASASWSNTKSVLCGAFIQYRKLNLN